LRWIDHAHRSVDAEHLQILDERRGDPFEGRLEIKDLEFQLLALVVDALAVLDCPAGLIEQLARLLQLVANVAGT